MGGRLHHGRDSGGHRAAPGDTDISVCVGISQLRFGQAREFGPLQQAGETNWG